MSAMDNGKPDGGLTGRGRVGDGQNGRGLSRRTFLAASAAAAGATAAAGGLAGAGAAQAAQLAAPKGLTHTIRDLKHVVIFMQENRSFDHYFGMLAGVRGFGDKQTITFPNGQDVFHQADTARTDGGYLLPFHMDSTKVDALSGWDLGHGWSDYHQMWDNGAWDQWVPAKGELCMGYYTETDIPFQYAVAKAWTVCDHYHCSIMGPTHPNRLYNWTGTIDPNGGGAPGRGPQAYNNNQGDFNMTWSTFADNLQAAGVDWGTYTNQYSYNVNDWLGDWDNNALEYFAQFKTAALSGDPALMEYAARADVYFDAATGERVYPAPAPPADYQTNMDYVLSDFITDCANNALPMVSWIAAPGNWSEHPGVGERGAHYVARVIHALASNPETWASTLLIISYDEADGLFDHVPSPFPEPGTTDEFIPAFEGNAAGHIGPGPRVPALLISPWTRGGRVFSGVLDHTSSQLFVEYWLRETQGITVTNPNITDWRRSIMSNFQYALDFKNPDFSVPSLPDTNPQLAQLLVDETLPAPAPPATGDQEMPTQPTEGALRPVPSPYQLHATAQVDAATGAVTAALVNNGVSGASLQVLPDDYLPFAATPFTVLPRTPREYTWDTTQTGGQYAFSVYGPDRFVYSFAGTVPQPGQSSVPDAEAALLPASKGTSPKVRISLRNLGSENLTYTLTPNDYDGTVRTVVVGGGRARNVEWPVNKDGYYDVIVTDDSGTGFRRRFAGRTATGTL